MTSSVHKMCDDVWSNKHEKGYNSRKNQPSVKSVLYAHAQIMANQDTLCNQWQSVAILSCFNKMYSYSCQQYTQCILTNVAIYKHGLQSGFK